MHWAVGILIVAGCMVAWKMTSTEMHDRASPKYSQIDHYGWWITLIVLLAIPVAYLLF
jgi:prolipoprotein diacylglyceryltransferase